LPQSNLANLSNQSARRISLNGQIVNGEFGIGDAILANHNYYKLYTFEGRKNQQVSIEMTSQEIDPSLILLDADGRKIARNEDISASDFNSKIITTLPKDNIYIVLAISSQGKQSGTYSLRAKG
jgi:serine protease Do